MVRQIQSRSMALAALMLLPATGFSAFAQPIAPGYERFKNGKTLDSAALGEILLGGLSCASCHASGDAAPMRISTKTAPDLSRAGARITPQYLRAFLSDPHGVKPGTTMPDIFHASEAASKAGAVDYLTHYLVSLGGPIRASETAISQSAADTGKKLFHKVGCVACHAPEDAAGISTPIVPLGQLAMKSTVEELAKFLVNPEHVRASGRMPNLGLSGNEAKAIAVYLLRKQMTNLQKDSAEPVVAEGLRFEYFEGGFKTLPDFSKLKPKASGVVSRLSLKLPGIKLKKDGFAIRFTGDLKILKNGKHRFWLKSDDGSRLIIDGKTLIDHDGIHAASEKHAEMMLKPGLHRFEVQYFEGGGQEALGIQWKGPRRKRGAIPAGLLTAPKMTPMVPLKSEEFTVDPGKSQMGKQMFSMLRCVSCHEMEGLRPMRPARTLAQLDVNNSIGCLSPGIRKGLPNYRLTKAQRASIISALAGRASLAQPLKPAEVVVRTMATMNCYACHKRDGVGGPDDKRSEFFTTNVEIDLGDEGSLPPSLTGVGGKLQEKALEGILLSGEHHVRYFMSTRMPRFQPATVNPLMAALIAEDRKPEHLKAPEFSEMGIKEGHQLVGIGLNTLGCVNCHNANGGKAAGMPGIDLATAHERLNPGWFHGFLMNPLDYKKETRMPSFWPEGKSLIKDVAGGNTHKQIDAIWTYLALGKSMPLPAGVLIEGGGGEELIPIGEPIVHRTFMNGVGPRSILVGFPERVHVAFDANVMRLAKVWRGRFFDGSGVSSGRTDKFFEPLGDDILDLPPGPALAFLDKQDTPWPKAELEDRNLGGRFLGYRLESSNRQPSFRYQLEDVSVEERIEPVMRAGGASISRHFELRTEVPAQGLYFLAGAGKTIARQDDGSWLIDGKVKIALSGDVSDVNVRAGQRGKELILRPEFKGGFANFKVDIRW